MSTLISVMLCIDVHCLKDNEESWILNLYKQLEIIAYKIIIAL